MASRITILLTGLALLTGTTARAEPVPTADALAPVVVQGTAAADDRSVASRDTIDGTELRDGQLQVNLSEGLARVPGLSIRQRENHAQDLQISVRGSGSRATFGIRGLRLFVDGIPASSPDGQGQVAHFPLGSAERVDIIRGPFAALYGASSAGAILLTTVDGARPATLTLSGAAGAAGLWRLGSTAQGRFGETDAWSWGLEASRFATDGIRPQSAAHRNTANLRLAHRNGPDRTVLVANRHRSHAADPLGLTREDYRRDPRQTTPQARTFDTRKSVAQNQLGLAREQSLGGGHVLEVMGYVGDRRVEQYQAIPIAAQVPAASAGGVIDLDRRYWGANLRWRFEHGDGGQAGTRWRFAAGLATDRQTDERRGYENFVGAVTGVRGRLRRDETNRAGMLDPYLQAEWQTGRLTVAGGLRYSTVTLSSHDRYVMAGNGDDSGRVRHQGLLPVLGLQYRITSGLDAFASIGRGLETPTLNEVAYTASGAAGAGTTGFNRQLLAARSLAGEAGLRGRSGNVAWQAALFETRTRDEIIVLTNAGGRSTFGNAGRTRRQGLELSLDHATPTLAGSLAFTWLDARYRDGFLTCTASPCPAPNVAVPAGNRLPGLAPVQWFARLDWTPRLAESWASALEGTTFGAEFRHVGRMMVDDRNSDATERATIVALSVRLRQTFGPWTTRQFVRIDNLTDRRHAGSVIVNEASGRYFEPAAGRSVFAGFAVERQF